jgi:type IV pilus assembly protein PilY1
MKRLIFSISCLFLSLALFSLRGSDAAVMEDYCVIPPYVVQDVAPNVMIVLDNSGSMFNFAYFDGFTTPDPTDDNDCANSSSPCTGFTTPGTYPNYKYYGYFDPDYWYVWDNPRFVPSAPKTGTRPASSWDGNFLNWLTMRRLDIIRKVMTGGAKATGEGSGYGRLRGEKADCDDRGKYKNISDASLYTPYTGTRKFYVNSANAGCGGGGSGTSTFTVRNATDTGDENTFNVAVRVIDSATNPVEGVLQSVVGTRARIGLTFYHVSTGGIVRVSVGGGSLSSTVNEINNSRPDSNTPLAETLWTVAGYFAQESSISPIGSPGPRYSSGDYQINNTNDPLNYGTGGQPRYSYCAKSYVLYITDGEPCADGDLPSIETYASGRSAYDCSGGSCPAVGSFPASTFPSCSAGGYVAGIEDVALWAHTTDLRNKNGTPDVGVNNISDIQNLTLFAVFAFGKGSTLLRYAAINGGFEDTNGNNQPDLQSEWDGNGDGEPDTFYEADEGYELEQSIKAAFESILKRASSGTAASVLASGEGSGANLIQAVFYPRRRVGNDIIAWIGENQNFWYYADPYFVCSNIREDTTVDSPDPILNLSNDYIAEFYFDTAAQLTMAKRFLDSNGDGCKDTPGTPLDTIVFENLTNLWKAGELLWSRDISTDPRTIYTTTNGSTFLTGNFDPTNASTLASYLDVANSTLSEEVIRYMHGEGLTTLRDEDGVILIAGIDRKGTCSVTTSTSCTFDSDCPSGETCIPDGIDDYRARYANIGGITNVWKLGDVLDSTPRISSWIQLNNYDSRYSDLTYSSFINTSDYRNRGTVFTGGNDGMLHAFKLGKLELTWSGQGGAEKAKLSGTDLGKEIWAFIPKNVLPYLKYFMDPEYCHIYSVDLSPFIFDASIGAPGSGDISNNTRDVSAWRTILIGGMRFGGACRDATGSCNSTTGGLPDCVKTPVSGNGFSSYFALDITDTVANPDDPANHPPVLLWEFSHPQLGFTTTGPGVVRIGTGASQTTPDVKNGKWFVVFGSGPTGPIDITNSQFLGRSDQNFRLFVLDLKTGALASGYPKDTGITYAFAGSMLSSPIDTDNDYQDDAVYIGYVKRAGSNPNYTWTDGGVGRLLTKEDTTPDNWVWSNVIDGIGAVTASVTKLQKNQGCFNQANEEGCLWLYFGTGRYYFEQGVTTDDPDSQRLLYGIKEPCFNATGFNASCTTSPTPSPPSVGTLTDVTSIGSVPSEDTANTTSFNGWSLNLDSCTDSSGNPVTCNSSAYYRTERVITDPAALPTAGIVFFTTFKPYNDECGLGGKSFVWAVRYNTGGAPSVSLLKGVALLQVSTGSIEQMNLSTAFGEKGGRRTSAMEGVPPTSMGLSLLTAPSPAKRVLHIRER